ncbi:MAG: hypothetical protein A3F82_08210 [Deltaproteobacteria bacterium RIFCSPLOWO2_12_FULL_44_12]|nr:MAG: hypothetical protein A2979_02795 [Deltaproteobacteria bacterium RIFCSPLOWO2_01_FULL_45_74]OGQ70175.1 MAG: hypothetical protein A3F82_08210 [Deltaproteobacteria bacterium RIFCSPLOWO2_12_FULL_44_12]
MRRGDPECLLWGLVRGPHKNTEGQDPPLQLGPVIFNEWKNPEAPTFINKSVFHKGRRRI